MTNTRHPIGLGLRRNASVAAILTCIAIAASAEERNTDPKLRVHRMPPRTNPAVTSAFEAFNRGDLAAADASYRRALAAEPANADALLGLAAVALRLGAPERAENFFRRAVEVDPRNAASQAGLMAFRIEGDPTASVTRLKSLLAAQPDEPSLHFQLGNALAAAERWHDAQQAFLGACGLASDQPDYLYNLGVAFDRLRNADLARHYYERALTAARQRPAAFDIAAVTARIHELTDRHE